MPIAHLLDGTAQAYRRAEAREATFRTTEPNWAVNGDPFAMTVQVSTETIAERSGGERVTGTYRIYGNTSIDVQQRDALVVLTGPNAGLRLEVDQVYRPRGHHLQLVCLEFDGALP